jgi:YgiT-type zinc finger domain-containing protein
MKSNKNCNCENLVKRKITDMLPIAGQMVKVENAPARVCQDCGEVHFEGRFLLDLEKKLTNKREKQAA